MQISPIKRPLKPPRVEGYQYGLLSDRNNTIGNSLQLIETEDRPFARLSILGETSATPTDPEQEVSPDNPQTLSSLTSFEMFESFKNLMRVDQTFPKTASGVTISYDPVTQEFTLNGTASAGAMVDIFNDATKKYRYKIGKNRTLSIIRVSGTNSDTIQMYHNYGVNGGTESNNFLATLSSAANSITSSRTAAAEETSSKIYLYFATGRVFTNLKIKLQIEIGDASAWEPSGIYTTAPITLKDTANNQLSLCGRALTYNANGTPATWYGQDKIVKKSDGKWYHRKMGEFEADATSRADFWKLIATPVDTELAAADQTALASVEKTFSGITNIMLSTPIGKIKVEQWSKSAMR
jgi:hypothetical protein